MRTASMMAPEELRAQANLNPHKEARIAMYVFGERYAAQRGGSMDFWRSLSTSDRKVCRDLLEHVEATKTRAPARDFLR